MQFQRKTLPNGLRVVIVPMPGNLNVTVLALTATGSKYETKDLSGVSHFLEHMCFKGTTKRPSALAISGELDGLGAQYNAFTAHECTGYYAKAEKRHLAKILDVVADIFQNATLPAEEMEKERGVVIGEIEMYEDNPQDHVGDLFMEAMYGNQPAGWNVAGTRETVRQMTREEMAEYRKDNYTAASSAIVVAGGFDEETIWEEISKAFVDIRQGEKAAKLPVDDSQKSPVAKVEHKKSQQTHLILGFRAFNVYDERQKTLRLLAAVLGGGMSSRLFQRIREKMGAGYYVNAGAQFFTDHGIFSVNTGASNARVKEVVQAIMEEVARIANEKVPADEIERTKNFLTGNMSVGLETSSAFAQFYGGNEILGKPLKTPDEIKKEVRAVTAEDIQQVAREIFVDNRLSMALIGPFKDGDEFLPLLHV